MEDSIDKKYEELQDENLKLMVEHLNKSKDKVTPYSKAIRTNYVLLTKLGQMKRQLKNLN